MKKYPLHYYLILILIFILSVIFWIALLLGRTESYTPTTYIPSNTSQINYVIKPVDKDKIIEDEESYRKIVSNVVNIAIKDTNNLTPLFIEDFHKSFDNNYQIAFADSIINFFQIRLPENERESFKKEVKKKMLSFDLLVWDESIFRSSSESEKNFSTWYLDAVNLREVSSSVNAENVVIAVIDNGFDITHPSLSSKITHPYN